jgi:hypothetical protein
MSLVDIDTYDKSTLIVHLNKNGFKDGEADVIIDILRKPEYAVTSLKILQSLADEDLEELCKTVPLGMKARLKKACGRS